MIVIEFEFEIELSYGNESCRHHMYGDDSIIVK